MEFEEYSENTEGNEIGRQFSFHSCNVFDELRRFQQLCDAVIKVENEEFPIHRAIMSASSPYFRALFTNAIDAIDKRKVEIPGVSAEIMQIIIDYAYTRRAKIDKNNVESLLQAADQFLINGLVKGCSDFLARELEPENCIGIYKFARTYFCLDLERIAYRYLMHNIDDVMNSSSEYLNLDLTEVCEILSSDDLNVKSEEMTFLAVQLWIDGDPTNRKSHIADLLRTIRLGLLSTQFFVEHVKAHPFVMGNEQCKPIIINTLKFLYDLDMDEARDLDMDNPLARPRIPHDVVFVVGGWTNRSPISTVETYDTRADRWIICNKSDDTPRAYHGTVTIDLKIYVVGGFDGVECFNSVKCFDAVTKIWSEAAPMISKRCYVSATVLRGCIYAIGGYDGHVRLNTAERYFPGRNQWVNVAPMNHQRSDASATTLQEKIYICGGFNGEECLNSTEYYDPNVNQWTCFAPMRSRRSGVGVQAYRDHIYALGGFNGISRMGTAERYNPLTDRWESILAMYSPRSNFGVEVIDDMLFVIGGFDGVSTIPGVECFDQKSNEWFDTTEMNIRRSALSACVINGLPNPQDYTYKEPVSEKQNAQIQDVNLIKRSRPFS